MRPQYFGPLSVQSVNTGLTATAFRENWFLMFCSELQRDWKIYYTAVQNLRSYYETKPHSPTHSVALTLLHSLPLILLAYSFTLAHFLLAHSSSLFACSLTYSCSLTHSLTHTYTLLLTRSYSLSNSLSLTLILKCSYTDLAF